MVLPTAPTLKVSHFFSTAVSAISVFFCSDFSVFFSPAHANKHATTTIVIRFFEFHLSLILCLQYNLNNNIVL